VIRQNDSFVQCEKKGENIMTCEKCWSDAYMRSRWTGHSQAEEYKNLLNNRKDSPCTPEQQAGDYWDNEKQCDKREPYKGDKPGERGDKP